MHFVSNFRKRERTKEGGASNAVEDTAQPSDSAEYEDESDDDLASNASSSAASEAKQKKTKKPASVPTVMISWFLSNDQD